MPGPGCVQGATLQQPVDDVGTRLLVLVSEQGVHKGVAGCLTVSQALGDNSPVGVDRHRWKQLHNPAGKQKEGGERERGMESLENTCMYIYI